MLAVAATLAACSFPGTALARGATVSGSVKGAAGMTLAAMAPDGTVAVQKLGAAGRFRLAVKARGTTLQLIRPNGAYFGPVVLRAKAGRAYLALVGKTLNLGRVVLRGGYATPTQAVPLGLLDRARIARADRRGKPLGAGKLGFVRMRPAPRGLTVRSLAAEGAQGPGTDTDADGIPNTVDADDNGNLVLDNVDSSTTPSGAGLFSTLYLPLRQTINANASQLTTAQIDAVVGGENTFNLIFFYDTGRFRGRAITGAHVDCFGLRYCRRRDGTAILTGLSESSPDLPRGTRWVDYSPDGSGYPNLEHLTARSADVWAAGIQPRVGTADMHPGDTFNVVFGSSGGPITAPTVLSPFFVTTPALSSYSSGGVTGSVSYPAASDAPGTSNGRPINLAAGSVTLTFWRPQRGGIPGADPAAFMDLGHLHYGVLPRVAGMSGEFGCKSFYSGYSGSLTDASAGNDPDSFWPLIDTADDASPSVVRALSFTLDLAGCLRSKGIDPTGRVVELGLMASGEVRPGGADRASQTLTVRLPG